MCKDLQGARALAALAQFFRSTRGELAHGLDQRRQGGDGMPKATGAGNLNRTGFRGGNLV